MNDLVKNESNITAFTAKEVRTQVNLIQEVMRDLMHEGEHYGKIAGIDKLSLFKSGAEKLLLTFRLSAQYEEVAVTETDNFINYRIRCVLVHQNTSTVIGTGLGACNSKENKYATKSMYENKATPEDVKNMLRKEKRKASNGGEYTVLIVPQNPWDLQNTIYKMACKRALIAATLNATAASDIFTQDIEDDEVATQEKTPQQTQNTKPVTPNNPNASRTDNLANRMKQQNDEQPKMI